MKTPERRQFEHMQESSLFIINFENVFVSWARDKIHKAT